MSINAKIKAHRISWYLEQSTSNLMVSRTKSIVALRVVVLVCRLLHY